MQKTILLTILALCFSALSFATPSMGRETVTVSGVVTSSEDKQPLIGVNVISGSATGVSTLADGSYSIEVAPGTTLIFQYIGYKPVEYIVPEGQTHVTFNLEMQSDSQALEDVVVIAYGVRKKGTIAGSVSTVKAEKIESTPTAAVDQALQGQVPGRTVLSNSGEPSEATVLTSRGTNSINGFAPLYVVVGMFTDNINYLNANDIESFEILKDPSSLAIFGVRGANGVIMITTKSGKSGQGLGINISQSFGMDVITQTPSFQNDFGNGIIAGNEENGDKNANGD